MEAGLERSGLCVWRGGGGGERERERERKRRVENDH